MGLVGLAAACGGADAGAPPAGEDELKAVSVPALVRGNTELAADLYGQLSAGDDNVFFSPYSISTALAMTYAGARGQTASAMRGALSLPAGNVHGAFRALAADLDERDREGDKASRVELSIANALWGEKTQRFETAFTKLVRDNYKGGLEEADFKSKPDAERVRINGWVEDHTNDKIKDLLPQGILKNDTKLVLVNAIHFKAGWAKPFRAESTRKEPFTTLGGPKVQADMMATRARMKHASDANMEAIALAYAGSEIELVAIAPKAGKFKSFERDLDRAALESLYAKLDTKEVALRLPKFKIAGASVKLKDTLTKLGMGVAFTNDADLSGITGKNDTKISDVVHKAFIDLDEKGTEAAAATAVIVVSKTSVNPSQAVEAVFDRPFVFAIRDVPTGTILFLGRVANPKE
jgi:serpin B